MSKTNAEKLDGLLAGGLKIEASGGFLTICDCYGQEFGFHTPADLIAFCRAVIETVDRQELIKTCGYCSRNVYPVE